MLICGFQKTTLLDYPKHTASLIFTGGCNFRCPYCQNGDLVLRPNNLDTIDLDYLLNHLIKRKNVLDGVCITGGEPTLQPDLYDLIKLIKELGYDVKLDTNGTNPSVLEQLLADGLVDYVAMDLKHTPEKYALAAGVPADMDAVKTSVDILMQTSRTFDFEFRTTVVSELHSVSDIAEIAKWISGAPRYFLQPYRESESVIQKGFSAPTKETLAEMVTAAEEFVGQAEVRG